MITHRLKTCWLKYNNLLFFHPSTDKNRIKLSILHTCDIIEEKVLSSQRIPMKNAKYFIKVPCQKTKIKRLKIQHFGVRTSTNQTDARLCARLECMLAMNYYVCGLFIYYFFAQTVSETAVSNAFPSVNQIFSRKSQQQYYSATHIARFVINNNIITLAVLSVY